MEWRESDGLRWLEAGLPGATAAFTTRAFGSAKETLTPLAALGIDPARIVSSRQVHGVELAFHGEGEVPAEADGHVVRDRETIGLVFGADCLPVALAGPDGAAILHCGRRGLEQEILGRGVAAVRATAAAIGPGIGPCCYEVGLLREARRQLRQGGVTEVESADLCTSCEAGLFFSHRRDGDPRRQAGLVWLDPEEG
ncbi:MAG TPA: polyphenol oxidase family protein [Solirubrobacterales bacterium]|nr:polyphenol oxidase family protein [Solirubrobacterales bacterium]